MSATGWQGRLNDASSADDVVDVCREFLGLWTPEEIAQLPPSCRPHDDLDAHDVTPYALKLIQFVGVGDRATAPMLYKLSAFFTKAALRMAQVALRATDEPSAHEERQRRSPE
jgi:hypothetical protein